MSSFFCAPCHSEVFLGLLLSAGDLFTCLKCKMLSVFVASGICTSVGDSGIVIIISAPL